MISKITDCPAQRLWMCALKRAIAGGVLGTLVLASNTVANGATTTLQTTISIAVGQRTVTGKVTDESGNAIAGATVTIKGTSLSTLSDEEGQFQLNVPSDNSLLVVSYLGYENQEVAVGAQTALTIALRPSVSSLSEVVVVGFGTQKKENLTGSVTGPPMFSWTPTSKSSP